MASDHMHGMDAGRLLGWILRDLENGSALGIVRELFFTPKEDDPFRMRRYGVTLETPLGAAAGPHTQMAQNIVAAWLTGARYMELKTVQVLDQIAVTKPCIDMADEGYNCEWSQELTLDQSYDEYLKAWVLIHALHHRLGGSGKPGMIFNMSAGYSLEGIQSPTVQRFLDRMEGASADVAALKTKLAPLYPPIAELDIPGRISDNLTISCMHGCPPAEVEKIALHFIETRRLNTTLKLNPTLLGPELVRGILNATMGYGTEVPDLAFEHDIPYAEALRIIKSCLGAAKQAGLTFNVKLTNTLETVNRDQNLPDNEKMVYMSGRALHPISIALAAKLQKDFDGELDISFCAGVDALNVADTLACGLAPVTICSDLLKPGGYGRIAQYIETLRLAMARVGAASLDGFITATANLPDRKAAVLHNLETYAAAATAKGARYTKTAGARADVKISRPLPAFDCAAAPCKSACPAGQDIPAYLGSAAKGDPSGSLGVILDTNPFPNVLGKMCNQACRTRCMRAHYDAPLRIRDLKLCAAECGEQHPRPAAGNGRRVAVVGAGPAGLSCAYFLALAGCAVDVFEASEKAGGRVLGKMAREAERVAKDVDAILALGVTLHTNNRVDHARLSGLASARDAVYLAVGQDDAPGGTLPRELQTLSRIFPGRSGENGAALSLVEAVGEGRRAAHAVLTFLNVTPQAAAPSAAGALDVRALRRKQAFRLASTAGSLDAGAAKDEAGRCLQCDTFCGICVSVCPNRANILLPVEGTSYPVQEAVRTDKGVRVVTLAQAAVRQPWQVVNLGDFCNECGNCEAFCPSSGAPYRDKKRLHLSRASFDADRNGFFRSAPDLLEGKRRGERWSLRVTDAAYVYEDAAIKATLDRHSLAALEVELPDGCAEASLAGAVEAAMCNVLTADNAALRTFTD